MSVVSLIASPGSASGLLFGLGVFPKSDLVFASREVERVLWSRLNVVSDVLLYLVPSSPLIFSFFRLVYILSLCSFYTFSPAPCGLNSTRYRILACASWWTSYLKFFLAPG